MLLQAVGTINWITPAYAGSTSYISSRKSCLQDHPRLRGESMVISLAISAAIGSPPLARGVLCHCSSEFFIGRITPACAGSTLTAIISPLFRHNHPRLRGEYTSDIVTDALTAGSPPLTRGVRDQVIYVLKEERIAPACAGSTSIGCCSPCSWRDHPRLRGEYLVRPIGSCPW